MTDLNDRLAEMLDAEPLAPFDLDRVVNAGRRSLRRRATLTAVAGTAGTAAVTAAIAIPVATAGSGPRGSGASSVKVNLMASPSASPKPRCELLVSKPGQGKGTVKIHVRQIKKQLGKSKRYTVHSYKKVGGTVVEVCAVPGN
ncbi:MAG TPA: hypothetical protein VHW74_17400 [Mycobacteriales bacterium]|jgi:hypothetical protein|nr:hypothetical protein [Mycobacteriales bacterium]